MVRCPFHDYRTPSMQVTGGTAWCHATGCERHGRRIDVIDFVMYTEGLTKHEAIVRCKGLAGEVMLNGAGIKPKPKAKAATEVEDLDPAAMYREAVASLARSPAARRYLDGRGLGSLRDVGYNSSRARAMRECIVWPLRDSGGEVVSLYGRCVREGRGRHYYSRGRRGLYPG